MKLYVEIERDVALNARTTQHGRHAVEVDDAWLAARTDEEIELLKSVGGDHQRPIGPRVGPVESPHYHDSAVALVETTPDAVARWLAETIEAVARYRANETAEAERKRQTALTHYRERAEKWLQEYTDVNRLVKQACAKGFHLADPPRVYGLDDNVSAAAFPELTAEITRRLDSARTIGQNRQKRWAELEQEEADQKAAQKQTAETERLAWIARFGSDHLKDLVELKIPHVDTYRKERLALEVGADWLPYDGVCGVLVEIRDATPEAVAELKVARLRAPKHAIELKWMRDSHHQDDCPGDCAVNVPVLAVEFLGHTYTKPVYG
jgi:hypothetical protein